MITNCNAYKAALQWQAKLAKVVAGTSVTDPTIDPAMTLLGPVWAAKMSQLISNSINTYLNSVPVGP